MNSDQIEQQYKLINEMRSNASGHIVSALDLLADAVDESTVIHRFDLALDIITLCIKLQEINKSVPGGQFVPRPRVPLDEKGKVSA